MLASTIRHVQPGTSGDTSQVPERGLSIAEAATELGVSLNTIRARIRRGELRAEQHTAPRASSGECISMGHLPMDRCTLVPAQLPARYQPSCRTRLRRWLACWNRWSRQPQLLYALSLPTHARRWRQPAKRWAICTPSLSKPRSVSASSRPHVSPTLPRSRQTRPEVLQTRCPPKRLRGRPSTDGRGGASGERVPRYARLPVCPILSASLGAADHWPP